MILSGLGILDIHTQTVCVRICGKHQVCIFFLGQLQSQFKRLCRLRIWIADGRKIAIRKFLLRNDIDILKTDLSQHPARRNIAGSVKRSVHDLEILAHSLNAVPVDDLLLELLHIFVIDRCADHFIESLCHGILLVHGLYCGIICHSLHLIHDPFVVRRGNLGSVLPVYFIAIVLRWVVARCHIDTCHTSELADCKRKLRCRAK